MRVAPLLIGLLPALAFADAATPTPSVRGDKRQILAECGRRFERRFDAFRRGEPAKAGAVVVMADADPPQVQFRFQGGLGQKMTAAVLAGDGSSQQAWERDDQWNYPIDPAIAWRERRALPDLEGVVTVYHAPFGNTGRIDEETPRKRFVTVAKRAVDDCMDALTGWTPPEGTLLWRRAGSMLLDEFRFGRDGAASIAHHTDGGAVGEMGTISGRDATRLFDQLRAHHLCAIASGGLDEVPWGELTVDANGLRCTVKRTMHDWKTDPDADAAAAAVEELRDRLFPSLATARKSR